MPFVINMIVNLYPFLVSLWLVFSFCNANIVIYVSYCRLNYKIIEKKSIKIIISLIINYLIRVIYFHSKLLVNQKNGNLSGTIHPSHEMLLDIVSACHSCD